MTMQLFPVMARGGIAATAATFLTSPFSRWQLVQLRKRTALSVSTGSLAAACSTTNAASPSYCSSTNRQRDVHHPVPGSGLLVHGASTTPWPVGHTAAYHTSSSIAQTAQPEPVLAEAAEDGTTRLLLDNWGAVSSIPSQDLNAYLTALRSQQYANQDGRRVDDGRYKAFIDAAKQAVPAKRVITDALRLLAYGGDASFYRLLPKAVVKVHNEQEVQALLQLAARHAVPLTFRAAGTSLSGQAITDSILVKLSHVGRNFRRYEILDGGRKVLVEPGLLGGEVNKFLAAYARRHKRTTTYRIGPDPASIDSCMVGGIAANNASGMCCGVDQNSYKTVADMRLLLADSTVLDTADPASVAAFKQSHSQLCQRLSNLAAKVQADQMLADTIRRKYKIKNTVGYSLNALVDFPPEDPINIIKHLMIGSEGTLGFISSITYHTVEELPRKASAFVLFPDIHSACEVVMALRGAGRIPSAVELCDYASLRLAKDSMKALVPHLSTAQPGAAGLLVEVKGVDTQHLDAKISQVQDIMRHVGVGFGGSSSEGTPLEAYPFKTDVRDYRVYWDFRKGLIPIIGGSRGVGTSMLIEDVVCPPEHLADMTQDLVAMFRRHGYEGASACGHALDGNLHLVFAQGFRTAEEVATFGALMADMADIVANKYQGSLKGEHGTGRNMAPFVELEWGHKAKQVMQDIKDIFDPHNLLNPGVILNPDPNAHMLHLKPSPPASPIVDHCMECGYCEAVCPSRDLSLTPRQRITTFREINRLRALGDNSRTPEQTQRMQDMTRDWQYQGDATCAADGMCGVRCPVNINTGELVKQVRAAAVEASASQPAASSSSYVRSPNVGPSTSTSTSSTSTTAAAAHTGSGGGSSQGTGMEGGGEGAAGGAAAASSTPRSSVLSRGSLWVARHFKAVNAGVPVLLNTVDFFHRVLGPRPLEVVSGTLNRWTNHLVPKWNPYLPKGGTPVKLPAHQSPADLATEAARQTGSGVPRRVLYFPTCVTRMMGPAAGDPDTRPVSEVFIELCNKAGYEVVIPQGVEGLCCGMMFDSRGAKSAAGLKYAESAQALLSASELGQLPVVVDNSPCLAHLRSGGLAAEAVRGGLHDPVGFTLTYLAPSLEFTQVKDSVAVHVPCTSKQAGLEQGFEQLAGLCAAEVTPTGIPCCGMAGDRGLRYPELTAAACQHMDLPPEAKDGYSTSRTCEIGVSQAAGLHFRSILHLVNAAASPKVEGPGRAGGGAGGEVPLEQINQPSLGSPAAH